MALKARRPAALAAFYREALGLEEETRLEDARGLRSVWLRAGPTLLMLERSDQPEPAPAVESDPPGWHLLALGIDADERSAWRDRLAEHGCLAVGESPYSIYFTDPEGHRFALSHWPAPAP